MKVLEATDEIVLMETAYSKSMNGTVQHDPQRCIALCAEHPDLCMFPLQFLLPALALCQRVSGGSHCHFPKAAR